MNSIFEIHDTIKDEAVYGRYVTHRHVLKKLADLPIDYNVETIGKSVQGRSIESITIGHGPIKILMWSQMHGNESTTTKAVFDLLNFLDSDNELAKQILTNCNLRIIPMLNPDGAEIYTRVNANEVDLNRDAQNLSQPESVVLRNTFLDFKPDFCFNLHDQRTIFNVGESNQPATVSFLAPAHDEDRTVSPTRAKSMKLIVAMNDCLQQKIPGRVGRYDDSFNANCVGDTFQMTKTPTILFESGHSPNDYDREETRKYIFAALCEGLKVISFNVVDDFSKDDYFVIPENNKLFVDFIIENPAEHFAISEELNEPKLFLFKEVLQNGNIEFVPELQPNSHQTIFAHKYFNCAINDDLQALKSQFYYSDVRNVFKTLS